MVKIVLGTRQNSHVKADMMMIMEENIRSTNVLNNYIRYIISLGLQ